MFGTMYKHDGNRQRVQTGVVPIGHALGDIVYSLALAVGEATNLAVLDWSRTDTGSRLEDTLGASEPFASSRHIRTSDYARAIAGFTRASWITSLPFLAYVSVVHAQPQNGRASNHNSM